MFYDNVCVECGLFVEGVKKYKISNSEDGLSVNAEVF
jgi:hypothetical protein